MKALRLLLPLALIALCLVLADGQGALDRLASVHVGWLGVTVVALNAVTLLSALRWRMTAAALDLAIPGGTAVREYYLAQLVNQTLPGGVVGDAARAVRSRQDKALKPAAQAVVLERAAGQIAMAAIALLGLALALGGPLSQPLDHPALIWLPLGLLGAILALLAWLVLRRTAAPGSWGQAVRHSLLRQFPAQAALSLGIAALTVLAFGTAARATGTALPVADATLIVPLILTAMVLPASVGGWGWREGAAAALFPLAGGSAEAGLAASIAFGLAMLVSALPGAFFLLRRDTAPAEMSPAGPQPEARGSVPGS